MMLGGETLTNPAATFITNLLNDACSKNASDIHFYPFPDEDKTNVYYRLLGKREFLRSINKSVYQMILTYLKFTSGMDIGENRRPQNGTHFHQNKDKQTFYLRLSTLPLSNTESITIRILPQQESLALDQLFLFPFQFQHIIKWLNRPSGIILFTGPTGCGKTTTMYALLQYMLREKSFQAITLEDPVEKKLDDILQVEVNESAGISYQSGLKAALRHDPDILMIGEIRDRQTAEFAFEASLTGHLVLSTLHAKDAYGTIDRLLDLGIKRVELLQSLIAVAAIELIPIEKLGKIYRRAAIMELLEGDILSKTIKKEVQFIDYFQTFKYLREKAYAYGFISEETFKDTNN